MEINVYSFEERRPLHEETILLLKSSGNTYLCNVIYPSKDNPKKYCPDFYELREVPLLREIISFGEKDLYIKKEDLRKVLENTKTKNHCYAI